MTQKVNLRRRKKSFIVETLYNKNYILNYTESNSEGVERSKNCNSRGKNDQLRSFLILRKVS